jgi:HEAT repeat protein
MSGPEFQINQPVEGPNPPERDNVDLAAELQNFGIAARSVESQKLALLQKIVEPIGISLGEKLSGNPLLGTELYLGSMNDTPVVVKFYTGALSEGSSSEISRFVHYFNNEKDTLEKCLKFNKNLYPDDKLFTPLLGVVHTEQIKALVIEYIHNERGDLLFNKVLESKESFSEDKLIAFLETGLKALHCLQSSETLHRDIHPRNLLIDESGKITLLDLNTAKPVGHTSLTMVEPDHFYPLDAYSTYPSQSTDSYAIGIIASCLYTGQSQYNLRENQDLDVDKLALPERLKPFFKKLCASNPNDRYQTAKEALEELSKLTNQKEQIVQQKTTETKPVPQPVKATLELEDSKTKVGLWERFVAWNQTSRRTKKIIRLSYGYPYERLEAVSKIKDIPDSNIRANILVRLSNDKLWEVRRAVANSTKYLPASDLKLNLLIKLVADKHRDVRRDAALTAAYSLPVSDITEDFIVKLANVENYVAKEAVCRIIFRRQKVDNFTIKLLTQFANDDETSYIVASTLGALPVDNVPLSLIVHLATKRDKNIRIEILKAIAKLPDSDQKSSLLYRLSEDNELEVRRAAYQTIYNLTYSDKTGELLDKLANSTHDYSPRIAALKAISKLPENDLKFNILFRFAQDQEYEVRALAYETIANLPGCDKKRDLLFKLVYVGDRLLQLKILEIITNLQDSDLTPDFLVGLANLPYVDVRFTIVDIIANYPDSNLKLKLLSQLANDHSVLIRTAVAKCITKLEVCDETEKLLVQLANDNDSTVKKAAIEAIGQFPVTNIIADLLSDLANNRDYSVRCALAARIGHLPVSNTTQNLLAQLAKDRHTSVRATVAETIGKLPVSGVSLDLLTLLAKDMYGTVRISTASTITSLPVSDETNNLLGELFKHEYPEIRRAVALALGNRSEFPYTFRILTRLIEDKDRGVREAALTSASHLGYDILGMLDLNKDIQGTHQSDSYS